MKLIIAGTRSFNKLSIAEISNFLALFELEPKEIVSGGATGIDRLGEWYSDYLRLPLTKFPANWDQHGPAAGPIRNREMAQYADALLLIWDGQSRGSSNMKIEMQKLNKPIYEIIIRFPKPSFDEAA